MNKVADRLSAIVATSLDTQASTEDLARKAYQSRTQFHKLFRTVVEETPGAMRRRLLLERAAYQLGHTGMSPRLPWSETCCLAERPPRMEETGCLPASPPR